jgi:PAS domain S-box-containing protein
MNPERLLYISPAVEKLWGRPAESFYQNPRTWQDAIHPDDQVRVRAAWEACTRGESPALDVEFRVVQPDGSIRWVWDNGTPIRNQAGEVVRMSGMVKDVTERKQAEDARQKLEEQLFQSQKMDAIGQLAGGVAHDFNNQLNVIMGYADLLKMHMTDPKQQQYIENIGAAARRSADLTKNLLAFARKGQYQNTPINVHKIIVETVAMLDRTLDKRIEIKQLFNASSDVVIGDPSQLQNAFLNLAVNARDAMASGGKLSFETECVELDSTFSARHGKEVPPGKYIKISVSDTGCGMTESVKTHLFEPFFTTKAVGKGTGMGLASVYGTVKNHKGTIDVYSVEGRGTTFKIYLPLADQQFNDGKAERVRESMQMKMVNKLRVLMVEDEEILRVMFAEMLDSVGMQYFEAHNGRQAVEIYRQHWKQIDLVILDMVMPEMNGPDTFRAMKEINPDVKALLSTGYSLNSEVQAILDEGVAGFIQKPYTKRDLIEKIIDAMS